MVGKSLLQSILQSLFHGAFAPLVVVDLGSGAALGLLILFGGGQHNIGGIGSAVEHQILNFVAELEGYGVVIDHAAGVHNAHVHALGHSVVEEDGVNALADVGVATEREAEVADAAAYLGIGQVGLDPLHGADEVHGIVVMLGHTSGNGQNVGVEYDVGGLETDLFCQQTVGSGAYFDASVECCGLPLFVEGHDHHSGTVSLYNRGFAQKLLLALLEAYGVHNGFALQALETSLNDLPLRRVDHNGQSGHIGLRGQEVEEGGHLVNGVEHTVVHVHINNIGTVLGFGTGNVQSLIVLLFVDEPQELA